MAMAVQGHSIRFFGFQHASAACCYTHGELEAENTTDVVARFSAIVDAPGFLKQLQAAKQNPD